MIPFALHALASADILKGTGQHSWSAISALNLTDGVNPQASILGSDDLKFQVERVTMFDGPPNCLLNDRSGFGSVESDRSLDRGFEVIIYFVNTADFRRPSQLIGAQVQLPTADLGYLSSLEEEGLAFPQGILGLLQHRFGPLTFSDVPRQISEADNGFEVMSVIVREPIAFEHRYHEFPQDLCVTRGQTLPMSQALIIIVDDRPAFPRTIRPNSSHVEVVMQPLTFCFAVVTKRSGGPSLQREGLLVLQDEVIEPHLASGQAADFIKGFLQ